MEAAFEELQREVAKGALIYQYRLLSISARPLKLSRSLESFAIKTKFPPRLRPLIVQVALKAISLNEYNDNFFNWLPTIFPYNHFTMKVKTRFHQSSVFPGAESTNLLKREHRN
jgi:hypothetical protein